MDIDQQQRRQSLRTQLRQRRRGLSATAQSIAAQSLATRLLRQPLIQRSQKIALYLSNDGELDPAALLRELLLQGKECFLPVLANTDKNSLAFVAYNLETPMHQNCFGIPEPLDKTLTCAAKDLDLVLLPLVGFDHLANRMGMGGGFYDRTFAYKQINPQQPPFLLGLAHSCQQTASLETADWDIPLQGVATEQGIITRFDTLTSTPTSSSTTDFLEEDLYRPTEH